MSYPTALFEYAFSPDSVPRSTAGVGLMLAVANSTGRDVTCQQIGFTIAPGTLSDHVDKINSGVALGTHWSRSSDTPGTFSWTPDVGYEVLHDGESVAFLLTDIEVNDVPGLVSLIIYETTDVPRQKPCNVTKTDTKLGITSFTAVPVQVNPDQATQVSWTTTGADHCTLSTGGPSHEVDLQGSVPEKPQGTTIYTLTAEGQGTSTIAQVTVVVPEVRILDFRADPDQVALGATTRLSWLTLGAASAVINPGRHTVDDPSQGVLDLPVTPDKPFVLKASAPKRSDSQECDVEVMAVDIGSFTATPPVVAPGNGSTLKWSTQWASGCTIDQGIGAVDLSGTKPVSPASATTYQLSAAGLDPLQASVTVGVGAAITALGFTADPTKPDQVVVNWAAFVGGTGTVALTVSGGQPTSVAPTGSKAIPVTGGRVTVTVDVALDSTKASALLSFSGPLSNPDAQFTRLALAAPPGVTTPRATATIQWVATKGTVVGRAANAEGASAPINGTSGSVSLDLGLRPPNTKLWHGDVQIGTAPMVHWEIT